MGGCNLNIVRDFWFMARQLSVFLEGNFGLLCGMGLLEIDGCCGGSGIVVVYCTCVGTFS